MIQAEILELVREHGSFAIDWRSDRDDAVTDALHELVEQGLLKREERADQWDPGEPYNRRGRTVWTLKNHPGGVGAA